MSQPKIHSGFHPTNPMWDAATGDLLRPGSAIQEGGSTCSRYVREALSPDGQIIATSGTDGVIELRRRNTGQILRTMVDAEESDCVVSLVFSPDGRVLAAGYDGFRVRLWSVETGERLQLIRAHRDPISSLAFSPSGGLLAMGGDYGSVVVLCNLREETQPVRIVLSREYRQDPEETARFRNVGLEQLPSVDEVLLGGHANDIRGVCFSPDGRSVATVAADATLKRWNTSTGHLVATYLPLPSGSNPAEDWITYTPDGFYHCSPGASQVIRWKIGDDLLEADAFSKSHHSPSEVADRPHYGSASTAPN